MVTSRSRENSKMITADLDWLVEVISFRLAAFSGKSTPVASVNEIPMPETKTEECDYGRFVAGFSPEERIVFLLGLAVHIRPHLLDVFIVKNPDTQRAFTEFGGVPSSHHQGFLPTGETALFILTDGDLCARFELTQLFFSNHRFAIEDILHLSPVETGEPFLSGAIVLNPEVLDLITIGNVRSTTYGTDFPAQKLETRRCWDDKVFNRQTLDRLNEVKNWINNGDRLRTEWGMADMINPGYRCLFYGPPGTGKTFTATLLGKTTGRDVYRIDLSGLVSKYVGETIKNLEKTFKRAGNAILFFDEADAMFGKRTTVNDANDRFANQEVSYLLQKIEVFEGVIILASNLKENIDSAFMRRFQTIVYFPLPEVAEREKLWRNSFPKKKLEADIYGKLAKAFPLSGGNITNAAHFASLLAYTRNESTKQEKANTTSEKVAHRGHISEPTVRTEEVMEAIRREYSKEGKAMPPLREMRI